MGARRRGSDLTWLFDLDNVLHDASHAIFPAINANMNAYIAQVLREQGMPAETADVNAARIAYWQRYGATLLGLVRHHDVRPAHFLHHAHDLPDLASMVRCERRLGQLFDRLPGRKILLTNAPRRYAREVLRHVGLHRHFALHLPIETMVVHRKLRPKPSRAMLRKVLARQGLKASRTVLVEDTVENLKSARAIGLRTVWITQYLKSNPHAQRSPLSAHRKPGFVDLKLHAVSELPGRLSALLGASRARARDTA